MFAVGRAFFRWATRQRYVDRSPMELMRLPAKSVARERILTDQEIVAAWQAAAEYPFGTIIRLLILTGQRRGEIAALEWDWIDERTITLPAWLTKNKRTHSFPLGEMAAAEIAQLPRFGKYLFPAARDRLPEKPATIFNGWSKAKAALDKKAGVTGWAIHDLRRTFSSGLASLGVAQVIVEKLLNHISGGALSPIAQVYNRYSYFAEQKAAVAAWEANLQTLLNS